MDTHAALIKRKLSKQHEAEKEAWLMRRKSFGLLFIVMLVAPQVYAARECAIQQYAELPIMISESRPFISGTVNGQPARFVVDSTVPYSVISLENALKWNLKMEQRPSEITRNRASGGEDAGIAKVKELSLAGLAGGRVVKDVEFMVLARKFDPNTIGLIGRDLIGSADTEYDLANGVIRLFYSKYCSGQSLAYWHGTTGVAEIKLEFNREPEVGQSFILPEGLTAAATVNGKKIRVLFSTGASHSLLSTKAAKRVGIKTEGEAVVAAGAVLPIDGSNVDARVARVDSLNLGGESHKDVQVLVGDLKSFPFVDLLLGADFFLSHRVYIASNPRGVYFTYSGGPLFNLMPAK